MSVSDAWSSYLEVRGRYQRSVLLERDASHCTEWLGGYQPTPMVSKLVSRIVSGLVDDSANRAWSITGPYGTGKSAFALFLTTLLRPADDDASRRVRSLLKKEAPELHVQLFGRGGRLGGAEGLVPVVATGERQGLEPILLRALHRSIVTTWSGVGARPTVIEDVEGAISDCDRGKRVATSRVVSLFEQVAAKLATSKRPGNGLLVILDEAGKTLEYVAAEPSRGDLQLLQALAEAAQRSGEHPIVLVVVLHQSFEHYAGRLNTTQRTEWAKVQGRFENLVFREANEQMLRLAGCALERRGAPVGVSTKWLDGVCRQTAKLFVSRGAKVDDVQQSLEALIPLHPVSAASLAPLFRGKLSQNERSLFAFLAASEPNGLREFASHPLRAGHPTVFAPDMLYDYVASTLGDRMFGPQGRVWARVETALHRLPADARSLDARVLKAIGVLAAVSEDQRELRPSEDLLSLALAEPGVATSEDIREALGRLRAQSLVIFRRYLDSYQLWEGSDLDVDARVETARREVAMDHRGLLTRMQQAAPPRPIVARRHYLETGTLRHFDVRYVDETAIYNLNELSTGDADGVVLFTVPSEVRANLNIEFQTVEPAWSAHDDGARPPIVIAIPQNTAVLYDLSLELAALESVMTATPELRDDPVARTQLVGRIAEAERLLQEALSGVLDGRTPCRWHSRSGDMKIGSARELSSFLSGLLSETYSKAPIINNELLNRRAPSSSAVSARRELLTAMVLRAAEARLGIEGAPPELSMYRSLLEDSGIHYKDGDEYRLKAPSKTRASRFDPAWQATWKAITSADGGRVNLEDLYKVLRQPPFGMRDGVIPVLVAAVLIVNQDNIALYEDGRFVPQISPPLIERLLKSPNRVEVQNLALRGARRAVVEELCTLFGVPESTGGLVDLVRHILRVVNRLTPYGKNTRRLSPLAQQVREALLRAKEPGHLLFVELPEACGLRPIESRNGHAEEIRTFVSQLKEALVEIEGAYGRMRKEELRFLQQSFGLPESLPELRRELAARAERIRASAVDTKLKAFIVRAIDDGLDDDEWLTSVTTLLGGKPPEQWLDDDVDRSKMNGNLIARQFAAVESLSVTARADGLSDGTRLVRVAIAETGAAEHQRIVSIRPADEALVRGLATRVRETIRGGSADLAVDQLLSVLAIVSRELMQELEADPERHVSLGSEH